MPKPTKESIDLRKKQVDEAIQKDSRFSGIKRDPRFKPIRKNTSKVVIDSRFKGVFDDSFTGSTSASIDKKGRRVSKRVEKKEMDDLYEKEENESFYDNADTNLERLNKLARGELSDVESSSGSDESDEDAEVNTTKESESVKEVIEDGEATHRLACVNLNWDVIKAVDLLAVFKSFCQGGSVYSVTIYPSEYGKKRLAEEDQYGPEGHIVEEDDGFNSDEEDDEVDDVEKEEEEEEIRIRKYESERLKYFFAVIECDNKFTANYIYENTDGTEFMRTGSLLDLRFVPDDLVFDVTSIRDKATFVPENYSPTASTNYDVNNHSKVQLTWDGDDKKRDEILVRGRSKKNDDGEIDYSNYIASEGSSDEDEDNVRAKYSSLIKLHANDADEEEEEEEEINKDEEKDVEITFIPGLKNALSKNLKENAQKVEKEKADASLGVYEEYRRKLKEKRKQRKNGKSEEAEDDEELVIENAENERLFADLDEDAHRKKKERKGKKGKMNREERKLIENDEAKKRAELELLMIDEGNELKHNFDMREIVKNNEKKGKKRDRKEEVKDDFEIDTEDSRFKGLVSNTDYSIDVTNPLFVKTNNMKKLVTTVTKKRKRE